MVLLWELVDWMGSHGGMVVDWLIGGWLQGMLEDRGGKSGMRID